MKMRNKKIATVAGICAVLSVTAALTVPLTVAYSEDESEPVTIDLSSNGGSGITAVMDIEGLAVDGEATGLNPDKRYISLYYGDQATANPGRLFTCADVRTAAFPSSWGITPEWDVNEDGTGTLDGDAPRNLVDGVYAVSIREVSPLAGDNPYTGFNPVQYPVVACGETPDEVQDAEDEALQPLTELSGELVQDVPSLPVSPNKLVTNPLTLGLN